MQRRKRATPLPPDERRSAIVDAVVPLLERHGPHVTTKQVAEAAGIAEGTIFRVFPDKRALLLAVAEETVAPSGWRDDMAALAAAHPDLEGKVRAVVERMVERTRRLFLVMAALRGAVLAGEGAKPGGAGGGPAAMKAAGPGDEGPPGVPPFLQESARDLMGALTEMIFEPHAGELSVPPELAARALRSLVHGAWHPGSVGDHLTPGEITDVLLHGVTRAPTPDPTPDPTPEDEPCS